MQFLRWGVLNGCYGVLNERLLSGSMWLIRCSELKLDCSKWLLRHCDVVAKVFRVVAKSFLQAC